MAEEMKLGRVYLVGAGPGDPGLLTLRAVECLREADFVLYDYLTSPRTLAFASPRAEILCVDEVPGEHPQRWPQIHERLIEEARKGKIAVHLKGGDPSIFGRGSEEAQAIRKAGIPYEVVPGVTAALAASAYAEIPLTHRAHASAVALVTGHEHPGKENSRLDWNALARFPGTLAIYMAVGRLAIIAKELMACGKPPQTPAAIVQQASTGDQQTVVGDLATLEEKAGKAGIASPAILLIGPVVALKPELSWFESKPLKGIRVLITRPPNQAREFARRIERLGAIPELLPVIDVRPPANWEAAELAIQQLRQGVYDWLVFTSANGVNSFLNRLQSLGHDARIIGRTQIATIGSGTADALADWRLRADLVPIEDPTSEGLSLRLQEKCRGKRVLLAIAKQARRLLFEQLSAEAQVDAISVYEQVVVVDQSSKVFDELRSGTIDVVTLTSPNIARAFLEACDETIRQRFRDGTTLLLANSDRLASQLTSEGYEAVVSPNPTIDGLVEGLNLIAEATTGAGYPT